MIRWRVLLVVSLLFALGTVRATEPVELDYMLNCQGCHLADGSGTELRGVPSLKNHMARFLSVEDGRAFLIRVPGAAMSDLDDARLAAVTNWMLQRFSGRQLPADFEPYTAQEVAVLRASPLIDVKRERARLVEGIEAVGSEAVGSELVGSDAVRRDAAGTK